MKQFRYGDPRGGRTQIGKPLEFLQDAALAGDGPCIEWPFAMDENGYGRVTWEGRRRPAHMVALLLRGEPRPSAAHIACHLPVVCHNRACVRGGHIRWGTHSENHMDKIADKTSISGERNHKSKLTDSDVLAIRASREPNGVLAERYGVTVATICHIRNRKTWKHL